MHTPPPFVKGGQPRERRGDFDSSRTPESADHHLFFSVGHHRARLLLGNSQSNG